MNTKGLEMTISGFPDSETMQLKMEELFDITKNFGGGKISINLADVPFLNRLLLKIALKVVGKRYGVKF